MTQPITPRQLERLFKNASRSCRLANSPGPENPQVSPDKSDPIAGKPERLPDKALDVVHQTQESLGARIIVRITCRRVHLQDPDNGLFKPLVDQLRYCRLLPEDDHGTIKLETDQIRVGTKKEEGTEVEIIYP
jgi:hypothetical protein